ncbi:MAG TPA: U32 family peptidase, partial [Burkholderiaceae bacterium]|nr:U32 family peptidase [Burkholderiaceae bacterium]
MNQPRAELELLAPAASADIGIAAIEHGADAVYIGGPAFGARVRAANNINDIERLVRMAHRFGARVFVTLNTILRDEELEAARRLVLELYEAGVDALIIQDMGLLELELPPLQLHASTQCDIRTPEKARFLQDVGFSQLVLARELSLSQIRQIAEQTRQACLEFFIHGALCVSYSGQCYISHAQTGRSANRGDCSQACRLPYTLQDAKGRIVAHEKHLLSLKDNDQTNNLTALINAGIRSFKIEGRYKDLAYVKNVTAHYRRRLDAILEQRTELRPSSAGRCEIFFTPDPTRNFHRDHTDYFVNGRSDAIGAFDTPKYIGVPVGHVTHVADQYFELAVDPGVGELHNGDGLTYYDLQNELVGIQVNRAVQLFRQQEAVGQRPVEAAESLWRVEPNESVSALRDLRNGTVLRRNRDQRWLRTLEGKTACRRIAVDWHLAEDATGLLLRVTDEQGHVAEVRAPAEFALAHNKEHAVRSMRDSLCRLGNTIFRAQRVDLQWTWPRFISSAAANAWRREAIAQLEDTRRRCLPRLLRAAAAQPTPFYPDQSLSYLGNVANRHAAAFYVR